MNQLFPLLPVLVTRSQCNDDLVRDYFQPLVETLGCVLPQLLDSISTWREPLGGMHVPSGL